MQKMLNFYLALVMALLVLIVPGGTLLWGLGLPAGWAAALAPVITCAGVAILGQVFVSAQVQGSVWTILVPLAVVGLVLCLVRGLRESRRKHGQQALALPPLSGRMVALYGCVGVVMGYYLVYRCLPGPNALFQDWDLGNHINMTRAIMDSGRFSSFGTSVYLSAADAAINPVAASTDFYPAGVYYVYALVAELLPQLELATCINVVNMAFGAVVFPLGMAATFAVLFPNNKRLQHIGSVACLCLVGYPWELFAFGPIFPNLAGMACTPAFMVLFVLLTTPKVGASQRVKLGLLFALAAVGVAELHPNSVFVALVLLIAYVVYRIAQLGTLHLGSLRITAKVLAVVAVAAYAFLWYRLYLIVQEQGTAAFTSWTAFATPWQEFINIITQSYLDNSPERFPVNILGALFVFCGFFKLAFDKDRRWLDVSYVFACVICFVGATSDGDLKQILGGFWYADSRRLAAMAVMGALPLAVVGAESTIAAIQGWTSNLAKRYKVSKAWQEAAIAVVLIAVTFVPGFTIPGGPELATAFGNYRLDVHDRYSTTEKRPLSDEEREFVNEASQITGDSVVINNPLDGSHIAYGLTGMRTYYRAFQGYGGEDETTTSKTIREGLNQVESDQSVKDALESIGARYVLVLDEASDTDSYLYEAGQDTSLYDGLAVDDATPGFTNVLESADGTCRLYEIEY